MNPRAFRKVLPSICPIKAVIFDLGHTVLFPDYQLMATTLSQHRLKVDEARLFDEDCRKRLEGNQRAVAGEETDWFWDNYWSDFFEMLGLSELEIGDIMVQMAEANERLELWSHISRETRATLERLKGAGLPLGIVSNSDGRVEAYLKKANILGFFDVVVDSHLVHLRKPMTEIFQLAVSRLGLAAGNCLYVGDVYPIDLVGAWNAGLQAALLTPKRPTDSFTFTWIRSLAEIPKLIEQQ